MRFFETGSTVHRERFNDLAQLDPHRSGVSILYTISVEDAAVHITGDEAGLFDCIADRDLERIVNWGQWLACFVDDSFVLICGRYSRAIADLVAISILFLCRLLPLPRYLENLQRSVGRPVINDGQIRGATHGAGATTSVYFGSCHSWGEDVNCSKGGGQSATKLYRTT